MAGASPHDGVEPTRQCVMSRRRAPQGELIRLQLGPEGEPYADVRGRGPGRGVYVVPEELVSALTPKGLQRAFRGKARSLTPEEAIALISGVRDRIERRIEESLGLARRAGSLGLGMDVVVRHLQTNPGRTVVVLAEDLADRSRDRVMHAVGDAVGVEVVRASTRARIGQALGRETVGIVAVWHPVISARIRQEAGRLAALDNARSEGSRETRKNH